MLTDHKGVAHEVVLEMAVVNQNVGLDQFRMSEGSRCARIK